MFVFRDTPAVCDFIYLEYTCTGEEVLSLNKRVNK